MVDGSWHGSGAHVAINLRLLYETKETASQGIPVQAHARQRQILVRKLR